LPSNPDQTNMEKQTSIPRHIAFIMDGNGRWAEQRGLPRLEGHRAAVKNIRPLLKSLIEHGIKYATLYVFSTENWKRPQEEVNGLFNLLEVVMPKEIREIYKFGIKIVHAGRLEGVPATLQKSIGRAQKLTASNTNMTVAFAFNYGGRAEIIDAVHKFIASGTPIEDLDENLFEKFLYNPDFPDVDMVVRTGGEIRTSNFLIWQAAYSEYYFTPVFWPDFNDAELEKALQYFSQRQRRFGGL
jgi:undecaprenyl diphosphate synthase